MYRAAVQLPEPLKHTLARLLPLTPPRAVSAGGNDCNPNCCWLFVAVCILPEPQEPLEAFSLGSAPDTEGCRQHLLLLKQLFPLALASANCTTAIDLEFYRKLSSQLNARSKIMLRLVWISQDENLEALAEVSHSKTECVLKINF